MVAAPDLSGYYRYRLPSMVPGEFRFHLDLLRPGKPAFPLDSMVQMLNWSDQGSVMSGSMTLYRPDMADPSTLPITRGQNVRCRVTWDGGTYELWTMRLDPVQVQVDAGQVLVAMQDDMVLLEAGSRDWIFRKTAARPYGWTCDEIAAAIAHDIGMPVGHLASGTYRQSLTLRKASPLAAIRQAYANDKAKSGRSFVIRRRGGRLEVVLLQRNPLLYTLAEQIQSALLIQKAGDSQPTTILTGRGRVGQGAGARKVEATESDRATVALFGAVRSTKDYGRVDSVDDLRHRVKRDLASSLRLLDTATISHAGIPFIARGDGVQLDIPTEGYSAEQSFVYVTSVDHTVQAGSYTTTLQVTVADPYLGQIPQSFAATARKTRAIKRSTRRRTKLRRH